jgi:hypothetical protein
MWTLNYRGTVPRRCKFQNCWLNYRGTIPRGHCTIAVPYRADTALLRYCTALVQIVPRRFMMKVWGAHKNVKKHFFQKKTLKTYSLTNVLWQTKIKSSKSWQKTVCLRGTVPRQITKKSNNFAKKSQNEKSNEFQYQEPWGHRSMKKRRQKISCYCPFKLVQSKS